MREPPSETIHLPFESGAYRMAMGLVAVPEAEWFEIDALYQPEMAERRRLLVTHRAEVFGAEPGAEPACAEALSMMVEHLTRVHPAWFERDGDILRNHLTGERWDLATHQALDLAGRLVQEDLCLIEASPEGPRLTAAVLCFPSRWRLHEKLGRPLAEVHGKVPFYADRLARPVDRFMSHVRPGHIAARLNWSVMDDPAMYQPGGHGRQATNTAVTPDNAGETLYLRVERQTLRRLSRSDAVLFGIRVHCYPMATAITTPVVAVRLAEAVRALPAETMNYKSLRAYGSALLAWLDAKATQTSR